MSRVPLFLFILTCSHLPALGQHEQEPPDSLSQEADLTETPAPETDSAATVSAPLIPPPSGTVPSPLPEKMEGIPEDTLSISPMAIIGESQDRGRKMEGTATRIDARTIRLMNPTGTQELLRIVPGIFGFADDGFGHSKLNIGIRGLNPRRSARVLVLEDGVPIQPGAYIYPDMYYNPPVERVDAVEVVKGSAAVRYGPQTMGGVINYITRRPRTEPGGLVQVMGGNNGYAGAYGELGGWGNSVFKPEVQLLYKRGDGFRRNNAFEQYNGTFKLNIIPDENRILYLKANVNYEDMNATYTGLTEYSYRTNPRFNPKEHDEFKILRSSLDILYSHYLGDNLVEITKAYGNNFKRDWWRENDIFVRPGYDAQAPSAVPYYQGGDLVRIGNGKDNQGNLRDFYVLGLERSYEFSHALPGGEGMLDVGARVHWERFKDDKKTGSAPDDREGIYYVQDTAQAITILGQSHTYETLALAMHGAETLRLGKLSVTPGIRFEIFEQEQIDRLNGSIYSDKTTYVWLPGLGLNYEFGPYNFFAGAHRGFSPPSNGTLRLVQFGANTSSGGLDVEAEKSWNMELGLRGNLPWASFESAGFLMDIEDLVAAGRGTAFRNLGKVRMYGSENAAKLKTSRYAALLPDVNITYTYIRSRVLDGTIRSALKAGNVNVDIAGNEMPYAPKHTLSAGFSREFDWGLSLRADMHYVDDVHTDFENIETTKNRGDTGPVPEYMLFDGSILFRFKAGLSLSLAAKNILDEVYIGSRLHSSPGQPEAHLSSGILPGPGRQITLAVTQSF